ncbi:MAG: hypothetical protein WBE76_23805 [Terracidiphilus sp.]
MMRWLRWGVLGLAIGFLGAYAGDWAIFSLRGSPAAKVTVNQYQTVPLKGHKYEYDYLGTEDETCCVSLFPRAGETPCWWLRRHRDQVTNL